MVVNVVKAVLVVFFFILDAYTTSCVVRNLGRTTTWLVLHEVADHLLAVAARAPVADVYPAGLARGGGLPDKLVKREVVHHPGEPLAARLGVRNKNVGGAAARVVRGFHTPDGGVELWRPVAAVDADGVAEMRPQRFRTWRQSCWRLPTAERGGVLSMRRVTATREVVNSVRRKCSDKIIDMFLIIFVLENCLTTVF